MANTKFYLDTRRKNQPVYQLKLAIMHQHKTALITLGVQLATDQWKDDKIINHPQKAALNNFITKKKTEADMTILQLDADGKLRNMSAIDIKRVLTGEEDIRMKKEQEDKLFLARFTAFTSLKSGRTKEIYQATINRMQAYDPQLEKRAFEDITRQWLQDFDLFLLPHSPSPNARNIHFRNIRAVFNDALDDEITTAYPFRRFKIRNVPTAKRSLTVEQLRQFFNAPTKDVEEKYLDFFKLIFFLIGINIIDLCQLKELHNGRIEYNRAKTHRLYSIKVEPEAMAIINKYRGKDWLLSPLDTYNSYRGFAAHLNQHLQQIGATTYQGRGNRKVLKPLFPDITTYWARHTWATIAAELDIPKETIAHALGHANAFSSVTDIYINFDMRKVDEANRRVIDYVLYDKK